MVRLRSGLHQFATAVEKPRERGLFPLYLDNLLCFSSKEFEIFVVRRKGGIFRPKPDMISPKLPDFYGIKQSVGAESGSAGKRTTQKESISVRARLRVQRARAPFSSFSVCDNDSKSPLRPETKAKALSDIVENYVTLLTDGRHFNPIPRYVCL